MCYHYKNTAEVPKIESTFKVTFNRQWKALPAYANGFSRPVMPVITNEAPHSISALQWGLIPNWVKDTKQANEMAAMCLNAKIETVEEKPSFRESAKHKRCVIPATSFYEWKWLDSKGKSKQKFEISVEGEELFAFGGLWSDWTNKATGEVIQTFSIVTTTANALMEEIHNIKKRMPLMLKPSEVGAWLDYSADYDKYATLAHAQQLKAVMVEGEHLLF